MTEPEYTNHLALEKSPYLQQHAHHPIDWYPWGQEAFDLAKRRDKPIFLSIGYATCHWCHVMARESFSSKEVADVLNSVFVNIKVDREELPEIDSIYMELSQALMSTGGGWPLNVILTPDLKPFFAVTYLPAKTKNGLMGLIEFAGQIQLIWESEERDQVVLQSEKVVELFEEGATTLGAVMPSGDSFGVCVEALFDVVDPVYGGIKGEPKFPISYACDFMYGLAKVKGETRALFFADLTLDRMALGGIYDRLGGGFSRYTIDAMWHIPHFEKTLVDNSLLARSYLAGWRSQKRGLFKEVAMATFDYLLERLRLEEGGFCSAEDADLEGIEGGYYTWTPGEILDVLGEDECALFCHYFGVNEVGNFEGRNVLHAHLSIDEFADAIGRREGEVAEVIARGLEGLKGKRAERGFPFVDKKVVASANGFAISAFALAGAAFGEQRYCDAALNAATYLQMNLIKEGRLFRRFCEGEAAFQAGLDDYSSVISGALTLFETGYGTDYLRWALEMTDEVEERFKANGGGAFFQTDMEEEVIVRKCDFYDGAEPSGNSVHAENLLRLYQITGEEKYLQQVKDVFMAAGEFMTIFPPGATYLLGAFMRYLDPGAPVIVVALDEEGSGERELKEALFSRLIPTGVMLWKRFGDELFDKCAPQHADKGPVDGKTTLFVCREGRCEPPMNSLESMLKRVNQL